MKKNIFVVVILIILLSLIAFYTFRWSEISKTTKELSNIISLAYEIEILGQKQKLLLGSLASKTNYDDITKSNEDFEKKVNSFVDVLYSTQDKELVLLAKVIKVKTSNSISICEDIKTDSAQIKNSIIWLTNVYKKYLQKMKSSNDIDARLMDYMFEIISANNMKSLYDIELYKIESKKLVEDKLNAHLNLVYTKHNNLYTLYNEYFKNDIDNELRSLHSYLENSSDKLSAETSVIIKSLIVSSIFLLLYGFIVYVKEIISSNELLELKNELQQFVDSLNESAIVSKADLEGNITYVNDKFCQISGYTREELLGKNHNIIRHPDMSPEKFKELWSTIKSKKIFKETIKNRKKNGDAYYVDSVIIPILDVKGDITEYLAVRYEVTELVDSIEKAVLAEKVKNEFFSNMSHELRTPLNAINGFSGILKKQIENEDHSMYVQHIVDSSAHLIGLINDILDLSKLQSGKFSLDHHDFKADEKMNALLSRFNSQLEISELKMNIDMDDSLDVTLHGDWLRIAQIITNLISNALKFSSKGSEILFNVRYIHGELNIIVKDYGIGMSQTVQDKIFKPYEQANTSTTRKYGGTGLGLSIVLSLVEQMKGDITLESKEGEGSKFEVTIPLPKAKREIDKTEADEQFEKLEGHLLIAEDNKTNQMLIGLLVDEFGLTYKFANDGVEAVDMFGKEKFDLVLMDENMPNLNGTRAMLRIREMYGDAVPIVTLTANVMSGDKEKFLEAGMNDYISKPIDEKELYRVLKSFLKNKE